MELYNIMCKFPLMSTSEDMKKWTGFISTKRQAVLLALYVPEFPNAKNVHFLVDEVRNRSTVYWSPLLEKISEEAKQSSFLKYLEELEKIELQNGSSHLDGIETNIAASVTDLAEAVVAEIEVIGLSNIASLSSSFNEMVILHVDEDDRKHELKLSVPLGYPKAKVIVAAELPFPKDHLDWPETILGAYQMFKQYVEKCCSFWNDMDALDDKVKVVDPVQPNKSHYHRKILLEDNVIVHLIFNALKPRAFPETRFSGPERIVQLFSSSIDSNCNKWDETLTIVQNLEMVSDCAFISKDFGDSKNDSDAEDELVCLVCYAYESDDEIPDVSCTCGSMFHPRCILEIYANELKTSTRRTVECPNCQMEIRVPNKGISRW